MFNSSRSGFALVLVAAVFMMPAFLVALTAEESAKKILTGTYTWEGGEPTSGLTAEFTPAGEGHWKVTFRVKSEGGSSSYSGTADGKLGEGPLTGRVENDATRQTAFAFNSDFTGGQVAQNREVYTFKGEFKNGRLLATHFSLVDCKEEKETGTLDLGW